MAGSFGLWMWQRMATWSWSKLTFRLSLRTLPKSSKSTSTIAQYTTTLRNISRTLNNLEFRRCYPCSSLTSSYLLSKKLTKRNKTIWTGKALLSWVVSWLRSKLRASVWIFWRSWRSNTLMTHFKSFVLKVPKQWKTKTKNNTDLCSR